MAQKWEDQFYGICKDCLQLEPLEPLKLHKIVQNNQLCPPPKVFLGLSQKNQFIVSNNFSLWKNVHKRKEWPSSELVQVMSQANL